MILRGLRRWWQIRTGRLETPLDGDVPFWVVSLGFHLVILVWMGRFIFMTPNQPTELSVLVDTVEAPELVEPPPEVAFDEEMFEEIGADNDMTFESASESAPELAIENEAAMEFDVPVVEEMGEIVSSNDDFFENTATAMEVIATKGTAGYSVNGAAGAVDRLTEEILLSLQERKTTVVWIFDQSASLLRQREEIIERLDNVYRELGSLRDAGNEAFAKYDDIPLLTDVVAFGQRYQKMLKDPTDDVDQIREAIRRVPRDDSGIENVFSTVIACVDEYRDLRKIRRSTGAPDRNVLFIVVSDEAGDDAVRLDEAVEACNRYAIPVYVIGVPAPFGRRITYVKWVDPDPNYDQTPQVAQISQGPESLFPERLQLKFTGGDFEDLEMIDSGFGPFALTRLCYETGGIYFAVHPNRRPGRVRRSEISAYSADLRYFFEPDVMRRYRPDYVSRQEYLKRLRDNPARMALVQAAEASAVGQLEAPALRFPKLDEAAFVRQVSMAQRAAALLEPKLNQLYAILKQGESARERETSPRWQAGYDLAMGRVMAAKVRAESYNAMLAMAKTKLRFSNKKNNTWVLRPADSINTGSQAEKLAERARMYLTRVIEQHPNTPWAMLAARELRTPLGWEWIEDYTEPPRPPQPRPQVVNNNNVPRPNPQPRPNAPAPKVRRPPPRL